MRKSEIAAGFIFGIWLVLCFVIGGFLTSLVMGGCTTTAVRDTRNSVVRASNEHCFVLLSAACEKSQRCGSMKYEQCMLHAPLCAQVKGITLDEASACLPAILDSACGVEVVPECMDIGYVDSPQPEVRGS